MILSALNKSNVAYHRTVRSPANRLSVLAAILITGFLSACGTSALFQSPSRVADAEIPPDSTLEYMIFLIGDGGAPSRDTAAVNFMLLDRALADAGERSAIVFLGDNIYPSGMPPETSPARAEAERRIDAQLAVLEDYEGRVAFVPGNHDWGGQGLGGDRATLIRQEVYVESKLDRGDTFVPDRGYPGPVEIQLDEHIMLIAIDTQWWLEDQKTYGDTGTYQLESEGEFLLELDDVLWRNADKHLVVVAHHPIFTNGEHGGYFRSLRSVFTGEAFSRRYLGTPQDLSNLKYRQLRDGLLAVFQHHRDLIYAAGHDHSLQYFHHNDQHYVVSGSGSKLGYVRDGRGSLFTAERKGFSVLRYHTDGSIWLTFYSPDEEGVEAELLYARRIREPNAPLIAYVAKDDIAEAEIDTARVDPPGPQLRLDSLEVDQILDSHVVERPMDSAPAGGDTLSVDAAGGIDYDGKSLGASIPPQSPYTFVSEGTVTIAANSGFATGPLRTLFLGEHYRDVWRLPIQVPVIDLSRTAGGLTPIKKGGGLQTVSLRLLGEDGDQYVLRSINKDPTATIPDYLLETIAQDVVEDQIAAMHPYAAFTLPTMARAAGVFHTHPTLVYVPDDERLGFYRPIFANTLALLEARPDEDQSDEARFGYAENVIGTPTLIENIEEDNDEFVDQRSFARARLFDMFIGDWDRHKDQWRWAEFDVTPGKIFKPVPRDRDFAFFKFDGLLPGLIKMIGNQEFRRFTDFERIYNDMLGLNYNGAAMDRRFTSSLSGEDWLEIADSLQTALTDDVIEAAVREFPSEVYALHGDHMARILRVRRDRLSHAASEYYRMLSRTVDVIGSDKHERFEVSRLDDERTLVVMYKTKIEGDIDRELYRRIFKTSETEEVRLYGLGGVDYFKVTGEVDDGVRIRAIGGEDEDTFVDSSRVAGISEHTIFYDTNQGNNWVTGPETEVIRSNDFENNRYEMLRFELDQYMPLVHFSRNTDDGLLLGGGAKITIHGFRRAPYAAQHRIFGTAATRRRAYNLHYRGHFVESVGSWDGFLAADAVADRRYRNFYGLGNETEIEDRDFFLARIGGISARPSLQKQLLPFTSVRVGPSFEFTRVEPQTLNGSSVPTRFTAEDFQDKYYVGLEGEFHIDGTDTLAATEHGLRWLNSAAANVGVRNTRNAFVRLESELSYFYTFYNPMRVTLGLRLGGATNIGDFEFYQANTLGGRSNLRGYRTTRFAGHSMAFNNVDVRVQLFDFNVYVMRGIGGVLGFFDTGRVWAGGDDSDVWHTGYGGGIWIAPFNQVVLTATMGFSPDDTLFDISMGFQF